MSFVYMIANDCGETVGTVENKKDILPYLLCEGYIDIQDPYYENDCDIYKMLECEPNINAVIQKAETLPYKMLILLVNNFGFRIHEETVWNYAEYKHNHALD